MSLECVPPGGDGARGHPGAASAVPGSSAWQAKLL